MSWRYTNGHYWSYSTMYWVWSWKTVELCTWGLSVLFLKLLIDIEKIFLDWRYIIEIWMHLSTFTTFSIWTLFDSHTSGWFIGLINPFWCPENTRFDSPTFQCWSFMRKIICFSSSSYLFSIGINSVQIGLMYVCFRPTQPCIPFSIISILVFLALLRFPYFSTQRNEKSDELNEIFFVCFFSVCYL